MKKTCETCKHYEPHYVKCSCSKGSCSNHYYISGAGHCAYPRLKLRWGRTAACPNYEEKPES